MHLGRFHSLVDALRDYFIDLRLPARIDELVGLVTQFSSSRDAAHIKAFREKLESLYDEIELRVPASFTLPSVRALLAECKATDWYGAALRSLVEKAVATVSPDEMTQGLQKLKTNFIAFESRLMGIAAGLDSLEVEREDLSSEEAEVGLMLPQEIVGDTASALISELQHIDRLFRAIAEMQGRGGADSPRIRTIASSWWEIFLFLDPVQLAAWVVVLERIVALLKTNFEIRKLRKELATKPVAPATLESLDADIEVAVKKGLAEIASDIRKQVGQAIDEARNNELEIQLRMELVHLMRRISEGATIEIRVGLPAPPRQPTETANDVEKVTYEAVRAAYLEANGAAARQNDRLARLSLEISDVRGEPFELLESPRPM